MVKNPADNAGDKGFIPGSGRSPRGGNGNSLHPIFLTGKSHGQSSLVDYSPWGHKESKTAKQWIAYASSTANHLPLFVSISIYVPKGHERCLISLFILCQYPEEHSYSI